MVMGCWESPKRAKCSSKSEASIWPVTIKLKKSAESHYTLRTTAPEADGRKLLDRMEQMAKEGSLVIYLTRADLLDEKNLEKMGSCFYQGLKWIYYINDKKETFKLTKRTEAEKKSEK